MELFETWQGEGINQGKYSLFIRFKGCNLRCKWCDTKEFSFPEFFNKEENDINKIFEYLENFKGKNVVFTGGEPLLFQEIIFKVIEKFPSYNYEIETNGTIRLKKELFYKDLILNISPKPPFSQIKGWENRVSYSLLEDINQLLEDSAIRDYCIKFVIGDKRDKEFALQIIKKYNIPKEKVYIQAKCTLNCLEKTKRLLDWIKENKFNISPRLQWILGFK